MDFHLLPKPDSVEYALERLEACGYRITRPRRAVVRCVFEANAWLSPEEVLERARPWCPSLGLVTVYRTLNLLEEQGLVRRIHGEPGCHGYAPAGLQHGHHLVCRSCHQVLEFPGTEDIHPLIDAIARQTGFTVEDHVLELAGRCPDCREPDAGRRAQTGAPKPGAD
jgi:Fur family ferric uptake transcriptional regulator